MSFTGLTRDLCERAVDMVEPAIDHMMGSRLAKRAQGNLAILNPGIIYEPKYRTWVVTPDDKHCFTEVILYEHQWDKAGWEASYSDVSRSKAYASWKFQMSTRRLQIEAPWVYEKGWTKWPGSIWLPGNLTVSFSGVQDHFDELFSRLVADAIWALCMDGLFNKEPERELGIMRNDAVMFFG